MKTRTRTPWIKRLALGLAVAAIAAPAAQGAYEPLYQHQFLSDGTPVHPLYPTSQLEQFRFSPREPTHPFSFTPSDEPAGPTVVIPDPTRNLPSSDELQQFRFAPNPSVTPVPSVTSHGIDWTDAGIGAGMALGAIGLAAVAAMGLRRHRIIQSG